MPLANDGREKTGCGQKLIIRLIIGIIQLLDCIIHPMISDARVRIGLGGVGKGGVGGSNRHDPITDNGLGICMGMLPLSNVVSCFS